MKVFTSHLKPGRPPVLVKEGFSWGAALFGWLWLVLQQAWVPAALLFATTLLLSRLPISAGAVSVAVGVFLIQGLFGRDWVRWSLARAGYMPGPVVAAGSQDAALARLLSERTDLLPNIVEGLAGATR